MSSICSQYFVLHFSFAAKKDLNAHTSRRCIRLSQYPLLLPYFGPQLDLTRSKQREGIIIAVSRSAQVIVDMTTPCHFTVSPMRSKLGNNGLLRSGEMLAHISRLVLFFFWIKSFH